jgi:hypothetical protein
MLLPEICCFVSVRRPVWREDESAICSTITRWSESRRTCNHTLLSHLRPQPWRARFPCIGYIPQEQGGLVIPQGTGFPLSHLLRLALPQPGGPGPPIYILQEQDGPVQSQSHVRTDGQSLSMSCCLVHAAPSERISIRHQEGYIKAKFLMLPLGGLHVKFQFASL